MRSVVIILILSFLSFLCVYLPFDDGRLSIGLGGIFLSVALACVTFLVVQLLTALATTRAQQGGAGFFLVAGGLFIFLFFAQHLGILMGGDPPEKSPLYRGSVAQKRADSPTVTRQIEKPSEGDGR